MLRYETTFVFNNDFPALLEDVPEPEDTGDPLFKYVIPFVFLHKSPQYQNSYIKDQLLSGLLQHAAHAG